MITFDKIRLEGVKGLLIDIDDTLYSYQEAHDEALKKTFSSYLSMDAGDLEFEDFKNRYRFERDAVTKHHFGKGTCRSRLIAFQWMLEKMNIPVAYSKALSLETFYWESLVESSAMDPGALSFIKKAKAKKILICAVTDMQAGVQIKKLRHLKLLKYIDYLVTSEEVGVEKPNAQIFNHALKKLELEPTDIIMVGDSIEKDVKGAETLGIKSYQVAVGMK